MYNLSFKANYITDITVLKRNQSGKYQPNKVSLVSIDVKNQNDINALSKVCKSWIGNIFCCDIYESAKQSYYDKNKKIWAVTSQKNDKSLQSSLNPNKILCLLDICKKSSKTEICYIESKPKVLDTEYNRVGSSVIKYIKTKTNQIELFCPSSEVIERFYCTLGFKHKFPSSKRIIDFGKLYWLKNPDSMQGKALRLFYKICDKFKK